MLSKEANSALPFKWRVVLHLGSNQGDRQQYLEEAMALINNKIGEVASTSSVFETEAWGLENQPDFYNMAVVCYTTLHPFQLISATKLIESKIGRNKLEHWGPRNIDIDILYIDDLVIHTPRLKVPHNQLHIRNFVLYPLVEVDNESIHPIFTRSNEQLLLTCRDALAVKKIDINLKY